MPSHTPAYIRFKSRLDEVYHLYRLCRSYEAAKPHLKLEKTAHVNALVRSAIVMLCAHIQGFIEDYADQVVDRFVQDGVDRAKLPDKLFYYAVRPSIDAIRSSSDPDVIIERLREFNALFGPLVLGPGAVSADLIGKGYKDGFGSPTVKEIAKFFRRFGYETFEADLKARLKAKYLVAANAVDHIITERTKIAHGDANATTTPKDFRAYLQLVISYLSVADFAAAKQFRRKFGCELS
jgi:hypothetical protein